METKLSSIYNITDETISNVPKIDYFITALNCDHRGTCVYEILSKNKKIEKIISFDYKKFRPDVDNIPLKGTYDTLSQNGISSVICDEEDDAVLYLNSLNLDESSVIGIDITNFCIPDLFRIFYVLKKIKQVKNIYAFYTEPKYYLRHYNIWQEDRMVDCEREYKVLNEYFVSSTPDKTLLVCFLGFDYLVSKYVSDNANVKDTLVVNGFPSFFPKLKDISLANNYELVSTLSKNNIYRAQANDPFAAYNTLQEIRKKYPEYILNLCVLGTKPMALGSCIFAIENEDTVKVSYPLPQKYTKTVSTESSEIWCYVV